MVKKIKDKFSLNQTLTIIGLPKRTWYYHQKAKVKDEVKYQPVRDKLMVIARNHPAYGYRRAWAELNQAYGHKINKKVILRLMRDAELQLIRKARKPKPSVVSKLLTQLGDQMNLVALKMARGETISLFEVCYTDFTELRYSQGRNKAQLMPIIEHVSKMALGWALGNTANTQVALSAWEMATETIMNLGFSTQDLIIHHDRDPVFTGYEWLGQLLLVNQAKVSYALRGAKDNPEMESFNGHFKEESRDLFWECQTFPELTRVVKQQMVYYNTKRRHSSLGYQAPLTYLKERQKQSRF